MAQRYGWRQGTPPIDTVVEVWCQVTVILAYWTGAQWRTADGSPLGAVLYWRERQ
jgi:hypothetical protein